MSEYDPSSIVVLAWPEVIRKRPGMYVGDVDDGSGLHHLLWEVAGNVIDLHLARYATELHVDLARDAWVMVRDDGPGIPVEPAGPGLASILETVCATLHAKATFDQHFPHVHLGVGMHGVGLAAVNALSARFEVETTRDGVRWGQAFERGRVASDLRCLGTTSTVGTTVRFQPDPEIFGAIELDPSAVARRLQELA